MGRLPPGGTRRPHLRRRSVRGRHEACSAFRATKFPSAHARDSDCWSRDVKVGNAVPRAPKDDRGRVVPVARRGCSSTFLSPRRFASGPPPAAICQAPRPPCSAGSGATRAVKSPLEPAHVNFRSALSVSVSKLTSAAEPEGQATTELVKVPSCSRAALCLPSKTSLNEAGAACDLRSQSLQPPSGLRRARCLPLRPAVCLSRPDDLRRRQFRPYDVRRIVWADGPPHRSGRSAGAQRGMRILNGRQGPNPFPSRYSVRCGAWCRVMSLRTTSGGVAARSASSGRGTPAGRRPLRFAMPDAVTSTRIR